MANETTTSWILELVDEITRPARNVLNAVRGMTQGVDSMTDAVRFNESETREALQNSQQHYADLKQQVNQAKGEMLRLARAAQNAAPGEIQQRANQEYAESRERLNRLRQALQGAEEDMQGLTREAENFNEASETASTNWADAVTGMNQGFELIQKGIDGLDFTADVGKLTTQMQRLTDVSGPALDDIVSKTRRIAEVYDEDAYAIAQSANTMTQQIGGSYEENLKLIEDGYKKGANINGDFLDQLKEYPTFIKQLGLSQSQAIALIAQAGKKGIFSDKAIDSLKEGNMALREMQQTQVDALAGIGMKPEDLVGKTPFEAMQLITAQMKDAAPQARQMILTDLFKGAGEDAGLAFIEGMATMDLDLANLPSVEESGADIKGFFTDISTSLAQTFGDIGTYAQALSPAFQVIAGAIPIIQMLSKVTWIQTVASKVATVAQTAWNFAMNNNPIGRIILLISALVGAIVWVASKTEGWGEAWKHTWEGAKLYFEAFVEGVKWYYGTLVNGIMMGLNLIKAGWYEFKIAMGIGDDAENQAALDKIHADTEARKKEVVDGAQKVADLARKGNEEFAAAFNSVKLKPGEEKEKETKPSVNDFMQGNADTLGKPAATKTAGKKGKEGDGINVGGGSGGIKSITMTLDIKNYFTTGKGTDARQLADQFVGHVNDRLRDSVINLGG